jgi:hypothetical protein
MVPLRTFEQRWRGLTGRDHPATGSSTGCRPRDRPIRSPQHLVLELAPAECILAINANQPMRSDASFGAHFGLSQAVIRS